MPFWAERDAWNIFLGDSGLRHSVYLLFFPWTQISSLVTMLLRKVLSMSWNNRWSRALTFLEHSGKPFWVATWQYYTAGTTRAHLKTFIVYHSDVIKTPVCFVLSFVHNSYWPTTVGPVTKLNFSFFSYPLTLLTHLLIVFTASAALT